MKIIIIITLEILTMNKNFGGRGGGGRGEKEERSEYTFQGLRKLFLCLSLLRRAKVKITIIQNEQTNYLP